MREDEYYMEEPIPSQSGVSPVKGLRGLSQQDNPSEPLQIGLYGSRSANNAPVTPGLSREYLPDTGITYGDYNDSQDSMYDESIADLSQLERGYSLNNLRGELQPWYAQIGAGVAKGVVLAGTTLADGTIGTIVGAANMLADGKFSSFWNNPFGRAMQQINEMAESALPNYYTKQEEENPWYMNILSANFIGDKFLKNLGFTVGAFASGNIYANALKAIKAPSLVKAFTGVAMSSINEGKIEALNNSKDWLEFEKLRRDDQYEQDRQNIINQYQGSEMLEPMLNQLETTYNASLAKLAEDAAKVGNVDLLLNLPILMASNVIQFGKMYGGGYRTARKVSKLKLKDGKYVAPGTKLTSLIKGTQAALSEGTEEITQSVAAKIPGIKYASEVDSFYNASIDPDAGSETLDWLKASGEGILDVLGEGSSWEEFFIGSLTGALGMPRFRGMRGKEGGFQSPIYLEGGAAGQLSDYRKGRERANTVADYLNSRVESPEFRNYYQGLIRHKKYQDIMDAATLEGDQFEYKNAEESQFISDIIMFDSAGRLNDLKSIIDSSYDTSEENIQSIIQNTTDADGNGPFKDMSPEQITQKVTEARDEMLGAIDRYTKAKDQIDVMTEEILSDEQLGELIWLENMSHNWESRFHNMAKEVKESLTALSKSTIDPETREVLETIINTPDEIMLALLEAQDKEMAKQIQKVHSAVNTSGSTDKFDIIQKLDDMRRLAEAKDSFTTKFNEYVKAPSKLQESIYSRASKAANETATKKAESLKDSLTNASTLAQFRETLSAEDDPATQQRVLKELREEGNTLVKNYDELEDFDKEFTVALRKGAFTQQATEDALRLWEDVLGDSESLQGIIDSGVQPNQESLYDESSSDWDNLMRYQDALQAFDFAMGEAYRSERFKSRFPKEDIKTTFGGSPDSATTGDSETPVIASIRSSKVTEVPEPPVGDISIQEVQRENRDTNASVETPESLSREEQNRLYYHPAIPEFHIGASLEGDFRPFNIVVRERSSTPVDFDAIYNYLVNSGAFSYVNDGNLKVGDTVGFMIDPEFSESTIFMVKGDQVVGSLQESDYVVSRYAGLKQLLDKVRSEFKGRGGSSRFIASPTTRVSKIMVGRVPYSNEEKNLADIPGVGENPVLGIVKNGLLSTNGKVADNLITKPATLTEGRMYLLIPNAAGKYTPVAVRVKHFNSAEYNPEDITVAGSPRFKNIQRAIRQFAESQSPEDVAQASKALQKLLYLGNVHIDWGSGQAGDYIRFTKVERDANGQEIYEDRNGNRVRREDSRTVSLTTGSQGDTIASIGAGGTVRIGGQSARRNITEVTGDILNILQDFNLPIQVTLGTLNKGDYNNRIISSGVLTSNISQATIRGNWFTTDYFDPQGNSGIAVSPPSVDPQAGRRIQAPPISAEDVITGTPIETDGQVYYVDLTTNTVRNNKGKVLHMYPENIVDMMYVQSTFGDSRNSATMINGIVLLPNGKVINRDTGVYLNDKEASKFKSELEKKSAIPESEVPPVSPVFNPDNGFKNPEEVLQPEYQLSNSRIGYYLRDGKLYRGYVTPIGEIEGLQIYMTKVPNMTTNMGRSPLHVATNDFYVVFPNGDTFGIVKGASVNTPESEIVQLLLDSLQKTPEAVVKRGTAETLLSKAVRIKEPVTPSSLGSPAPTLEASRQGLDEINQVDDEFEDELRLRQVTGEPVTWDKEKELTWFNKVLPQLSEEDRLRVQKGLIRVADSGPVAWGRFSRGIITLSDIAAEGTAYHEAFHAVFNLLTDPDLREELFKEARARYGELSNKQLEEHMAEGFREYVMSQDTQSLGTKIINFFRELLAKVRNWLQLRPSLIQYYYNINSGRYAGQETSDALDIAESEETVGETRLFDSLSAEMQETLLNAGWTQQKFDSVSQEEREQAIRCTS